MHMVFWPAAVWFLETVALLLANIERVSPQIFLFYDAVIQHPMLFLC